MLFNIKRFWWIIENHYQLELKNIIGHLSVFWVLSLFLQLLFFKTEGSIQFLFNFFLILGGIIYTQGIFKDSHLEKSPVNPLLLPASLLEKILSRWLISFLNYFVLFLLGYYLTSLIAASQLAEWIIEQIGIHAGTVSTFNPFDSNILSSLKYYLFFHSWYFLGAIYFSKNHFIRSTLYLLAFLFLTIFVFLFFFILIIAKNFGLGIMNLPFDEIPNLKQFFSTLYWILIPLFLYFISFFRFRETEDRV